MIRIAICYLQRRRFAIFRSLAAAVYTIHRNPCGLVRNGFCAVLPDFRPSRTQSYLTVSRFASVAIPPLSWSIFAFLRRVAKFHGEMHPLQSFSSTSYSISTLSNQPPAANAAQVPYID